MRRTVAGREQRSEARHEELHGWKSYGQETRRVNTIRRETATIIHRGGRGEKRFLRKRSKGHERRLERINSAALNVGELTEDVELQGRLALTDHVLGAACDHPVVVVRRQVRQGDAALRIRRINLKNGY